MKCFDCRFMGYTDKMLDSGDVIRVRVCNIQLPFFNPATHSGHRELNDKIGCDFGQLSVPTKCFGYRG